VRIKKIVLQSALIGFSLLAVIGCSSVNTDTVSDEAYEMDDTIQTNLALYRCDDKPLEILFHADQAQISWREKNYLLTHAISASGEFYLGEGLSFWIRGNEAQLELNDMKQIQCQLLRVES